MLHNASWQVLLHNKFKEFRLWCGVEVWEECLTFDIECEEYTAFAWSTREIICVFYSKVFLTLDGFIAIRERAVRPFRRVPLQIALLTHDRKQG